MSCVRSVDRSDAPNTHTPAASSTSSSSSMAAPYGTRAPQQYAQAGGAEEENSYYDAEHERPDMIGVYRLGSFARKRPVTLFALPCVTVMRPK